MATMFQGVEKASAAFRLMQQMGWEEGTGLGKDLQGIKAHLRVKQKQDNSGIGVDQTVNAQTLWKVNTMEYDNVLKRLKVVVGQAGEVRKEEDLKAEASDRVEASQNEELKVIKAPRPRGRFRRSVKAKNWPSYSKTDLDAILGGVQENSESEPATPLCQLDKIEEDTASDDVEEDLGSAAKRLCTAKMEFDYEDTADWWGSKFGFVRAGRLGTASESLKTERTAFHEKDQEDLANRAAEKATKGKQGLGAGDRIRMGKGADWKGKRKVLDLDGDEDNAAKEEIGKSDLNQPIASTGNEKSGKIEAETPTEENLKESSVRGVCDGKNKVSSRWKKVCEQLLKEAPSQTLSFKRLQKRYCSTMLSACGLEIQLDKEKLQKSSRFVVDGKKVALASA